MLTADEIIKIARKTENSFLNIAREYFQAEFLRFFYRQSSSSQIFFKGGTALRLIFKSPRFSEDLDFSAPIIYHAKIEDLLSETLAVLEKEKFVLNILESKPTTGGFLAIIVAKFGEMDISLKIEISQRDPKIDKGERMLADFLYWPSFTANVLDPEIICAEKIAAFLTRQKSRDLFDIYFLSRSPRFNFRPSPEERKAICQKTEKFSSAQILGDLKPLLPKSHHLLLPDFAGTIKRELE